MPSTRILWAIEVPRHLLRSGICRDPRSRPDTPGDREQTSGSVSGASYQFEQYPGGIALTMRLTSCAAGIITLALAGSAAVTTIVSRAAAVPRPASSEGPALPDSRGQSQTGQQPQPPESSQTLKVQTSLVNVFVTVRDKKNGIISSLDQPDFKIFEDGVEQKLAFFSKEMNLPITLAVLIDTSGSMQNILGAEQDAASRFVKTVMRKKDLALVISFDFDVNLLADFTEDPRRC